MTRFLPLTLLLLLGASQASSQSPLSDGADKPEWKYVGLASDPLHGHKDEMYYDTKHVERGPDGVIQVYLKEIGVYKDAQEKQKMNQELIQNRSQWPNDFPRERYDTFAYSVFTIELDCAKGLRRYPCIADFNEKDERIGAQCIEGMPWEKIPQDSLAKKVLDAVCKAQ